MKISDIIHPEEYILSEVSDELEFNRLITDPSEISEGDLLIIPNSKGFLKAPSPRICPLR